MAVAPIVDQASFYCSFDTRIVVSILVVFLSLAVNAVLALVAISGPVHAVLVQMRIVCRFTVEVVVVEVVSVNALLAVSPLCIHAELRQVIACSPRAIPYCVNRTVSDSFLQFIVIIISNFLKALILVGFIVLLQEVS